MIDISLITCTYNPNPKIFERVLKSIEHQVLDGIEIEYVIVDNNSHPPVAEMPIVQSFLARNSWARVIVEKEQGLSHARIAGTKATSGDILVFVDDDNELELNYIKNAALEASNYSWIGVLGPGKIEIDYCEKEIPKHLKKYEGYFARRDFDMPGYVKMKTLPLEIFPQGNGQVVRRKVMLIYINYFLNAKNTITDRKGSSLSSWGDIQIDWLCMKNGYAVGVFPSLSLTHIIPEKRISKSYIKRLAYSISKQKYQAYLAIFPEERNKILNMHKKSNFYYFLSVARLILSHVINRDFANIDLSLSTLYGSIEDIQKISGNKPPFLFKALKRVFKID